MEFEIARDALRALGWKLGRNRTVIGIKWPFVAEPMPKCRARGGKVTTFGKIREVLRFLDEELKARDKRRRDARRLAGADR